MRKVNCALKTLFRRKKQLILLTAFHIFYENSIKTFLKHFINNRPKDTINMTYILFVI